MLFFIGTCTNKGVEIPSIDQARYSFRVHWTLNTWVDYFTDYLYINGILATHDESVGYIDQGPTILNSEIQVFGYWEPDKSGKFYFHKEERFFSSNVLYVYDRIAKKLVYGHYDLPK